MRLLRLTKLQQSVIVPLYRSNTLGSNKYHHHLSRLIHHNNSLRTRINIHYSHLRRFWKRYTLLISLSGVAITLSNNKLNGYNTNNGVRADDNNNQTDEIDQIEKEKKMEEESVAHLIETITVPDYHWIVWAWLFFKRFLFLVWNFTPMLMLAPFAYFNVFGIKEYWLHLVHDSFARGGSTFIKLGQWISMRGDIFPIEICQHLSELRMRAPSHSFEETCEVIKEAFGEEVDDIFDRFYIEPCASGSIAQVHKAQICINPDESKNYFNDDMWKGDRSLFDWIWSHIITRKDVKEKNIAHPKYLDVAVKVRHPNILKNMYIDISIMYFLSNFVSSLPGMGGLKFPIHQKDFTQYLESQIDLKYEGRSLTKMYKNFQKHAKKDDDIVIFPKVIEEYSNSSVLVETWEQGVPLCNLDLDKLSAPCRHQIATKCYDVFMKMALRDNFVHGDCHSGNILIRAIDVTDDDHDHNALVSILKPNNGDNDKYNKLIERDIDGPLIFLDAGLTASLTKEGHKKFGVMMGHIATAKCNQAAELFGSWAIMDEEKDPYCYDRRDKFVDQLGSIINDSLRWRYKDENGDSIRNKGIPYISIGPLLRNVLILTQKEQIVLDSSFSAVIASLGIIEGLIKTLDPSADFLQWGVPYLVKYRKLDSLRYLMNS